MAGHRKPLFDGNIMGRKLRILFELLCLLGFGLLFLDIHGLWSEHLAWLGKIQLVPAALSGGVITIVVIVGLTLALGRVYCSVVCPLGILQDIIRHFRRNARSTFRPNRKYLRLAALLVFAAGLGLGFPALAGILDPYSAFGRIAATLFQPLAALVNNGLSLAEQTLGGAAIAPVPLIQKGAASLLGAAVTFLVIAFLAWKGGRTWCNTLCPVGALLGCLSQAALFRPRLRADRCTGCGRCAAHCKASCIDTQNGRIDASRCVACFDCLSVCRHDALTLRPLPKTTGPVVRQTPEQRKAAAAASGRRALLGCLAGMTTAILSKEVAAASAHGKEIPRQELTPRQRPERAVPVLPAGAVSVDHFRSHCTGCQLCVAACPNHVLRAGDSGLTMLQPLMTFENGFCRTNCTACSEVCPAGAIRPVTVQEKTVIQTGRAVIDRTLCIVNKDNVTCTACKRSCPAGAISLAGPNEHKEPAVDTERCTGCGACEYICPARPLAAIRVEGNRIHRRI